MSNARTEAIAKANAELSNVGLPDYSQMLDLLRRAGCFIAGFQGDDAQDPSVDPLIDDLRNAFNQASCPDRVVYIGKWFKVLAWFPEWDNKSANTFMEMTPGACLLCIKDGMAYIVDKFDMGVPA